MEDKFQILRCNFVKGKLKLNDTLYNKPTYYKLPINLFYFTIIWNDSFGFYKCRKFLYFYKRILKNKTFLTKKLAIFSMISKLYLVGV